MRSDRRVAREFVAGAVSTRRRTRDPARRRGQATGAAARSIEGGRALACAPTTPPRPAYRRVLRGTGPRCAVCGVPFLKLFTPLNGCSEPPRGVHCSCGAPPHDDPAAMDPKKYVQKAKVLHVHNISQHRFRNTTNQSYFSPLLKGLNPTRMAAPRAPGRASLGLMDGDMLHAMRELGGSVGTGSAGTTRMREV